MLSLQELLFHSIPKILLIATLSLYLQDTASKTFGMDPQSSNLFVIWTLTNHAEFTPAHLTCKMHQQ